MGWIKPLEYEAASGPMREGWDGQVTQHGRMTNMKRTLAHNFPAFRAYMEWYPLKDEVQAFLGPRATMIFAHAISAGTDCLICSTFFRRILIEWGENPDELKLDERERTLVEFGRQLAKDPHGVNRAHFDRLSEFLAEAQIVTLTAFGGIMVATNLFNNALKVDLDEYLFPFRPAERGEAPAST